MTNQHTLKTARLTLRPFTLEDAAILTRLAGDQRVSEMTANIPHPYPEGLAAEWIAAREAKWQSGRSAYFAITLNETGEFIGGIGLTESENPEQPYQTELGYWIGVPYWGNGYATEAANCMVEFGFAQLKPARIVARRLSRNPASGKVLMNCGFKHLNTTDGSCGNKFEALDYYEILKPINPESSC